MTNQEDIDRGKALHPAIKPQEHCPRCGNTDIASQLQYDENDNPACLQHRCLECGHIYETSEAA